MGSAGTAAVLAGLIWGGLAVAAVAEPPGSPARRPVPVNPSVEVLTYYPAAAKAAGVSGSATITCAQDAQLELRSCVLLSESPAGQGFGDAALSLAERSVGTFPGITLAKVAPQRTLTVTFTAKPESVTPNLLMPTTIISGPRWRLLPTSAQLSAVYPPAARRAKLSGHATMDCGVSPQGLLADCRVKEEEPAGQGFGAAALMLAPAFQLAPPVSTSARIVIPIRFKPA